MKLNTIENIYMSVCAVLLYALNGVIKEVTITAGYLACLVFFPAYKILLIGAPLTPIKLLTAELIVSVFCISAMQYILSEEKPNEMCILFVLSYLGCKPFRFLMTVAKYKLSRSSIS